MASNIEDLKLGLPQSELIQNTKGHIEALYKQNSTQDEAITTAQKKADDAYSLASKKHKVVAYDTLYDMITALNSATATDFDIGDEIYIKDASYTRDFWISAKQDTKYTNQTDENGFKVDNFEKGYVGYFELSLLDERPDVTNMVTTNLAELPREKIVLGYGGKTITSSDYSIATQREDNAKSIPTSDLLAETHLIAQNGSDKAEGIIGGSIAAYKAVRDGDGFDIRAKYATKTELENAGTVKTVSINDGTPVPPDDNGNINLSVSVTGGEELKALYDEVTSTDSRWTTYTIGTTAYDAILVDDTNVVYDVLNDEGYTIITQIVRDTSNKKLYICFVRETTKTKSYFLRELNGNTVNGGTSSSDLTDLKNRVTNLENAKKAFYEHTVRVKITGFSVQFENQTWNASEAYVVLKYFSIERNISINWEKILSTAPFVTGTISYPCSVQGYVKLVLVTTDNGNTVTTTLPSPILQAYILNENILVLDCYVNSATTFEEKILNLSPTGVNGSIQATFTVEDHICYKFTLNE